MIGGTCTSGGILGTCYPNYNPAFSGDMWINGDFGSGGKSVTSTPYLDKTAFVDPAPYTVGNIARSAPYGLFAPHNRERGSQRPPRVPFQRARQTGIPGGRVQREQRGPFRRAGNEYRLGELRTVTTMANQPRKLQFSGRITF